MKKQITILLALVIAAPAFALPAFNAKDGSERTAKLEQTLQEKAPANKVFEGRLLDASFADQQHLITPAFENKNLGVVVNFFVKNGNLEYKAVFGNKVSAVKVQEAVEYANGYSADPHGSVDVYANVTVNGKTEKVLVLTTEKLSLTPSSRYEGPKTTLSVGADGKCAKCGAADPYHCNESGTGPCEAKAVTKVPTKVITVYEKQHKADCVDKYHCDCPEVAKKVTVAKEAVQEKVHKEGCVDKYHCDCPTKTVYR